MGTPLLAIAHLSKAFGGVKALVDVSLSVAAGERVAIIGPNGAGKSTLFNLVGAEIAPDGGSIQFDGRSLAGLASQDIARLSIGRTFQVTATFGSMTVRENVQIALLAQRGKLRSPFARFSSMRADETQALLERAGIVALADRPAAVLAYGDLKRVELAMALAGSPRLLVMDEPTAGLAPSEREHLMQQVSGLAASSNMAVLFTEHDMDIVFAHADRIVVLNRGRVIASGSPASVRANSEVRAVYLGQSSRAGGGPVPLSDAGGHGHA